MAYMPEELPKPPFHPHTLQSPNEPPAPHLGQVSEMPFGSFVRRTSRIPGTAGAAGELEGSLTALPSVDSGSFLGADEAKLDGAALSISLSSALSATLSATFSATLSEAFPAHSDSIPDIFTCCL